MRRGGDLAVSGNYAYVADPAFGLQVIEVSNPANPRRVGGYNTSGQAMGVAVSGNYAYVADGSWGLIILGPARRESPPSPGEPARPRFITPTPLRERPIPWSAARTSPPAPGRRSGRSPPPVTALPRRTVPPAATTATTASSIDPDRAISILVRCPEAQSINHQPSTTCNLYRSQKPPAAAGW